MSEGEQVVYDPDPTEMQLHALDGIQSEGMQPCDLATPQGVILLVMQNRTTVAQLRTTQQENAELELEIRGLRDQREGLRVEVEKAKVTAHFTLAEIPISILVGFAVNTLTSDPKSGLGWFILLVCLVILGFFRIGLRTFADQARNLSKGKVDA